MVGRAGRLRSKSMGFLAKFRKKIKREKPIQIEEPSHLNKATDCTTNPAGFIVDMSQAPRGISQLQQYLSYQGQAQQQQMPLGMAMGMAMGMGPCTSPCQPARGRKHVDSHVVEPKGLPESIDSPRGA